MSISSVNATTSALTQMLQMQQKASQAPLQDVVESMSDEDKTSFDENIESFSKEQMMYFISLMSSNESEVSAMSQDDATEAIFELMQTAASIEDLSEVEGLDALDALADEISVAEGKGKPPPPPPSQEIQDPLAALTEETTDTLLEMLEELSSEQKLEFGALLMDSKEELSTLDAEEASQVVLDLLDKASTTVTNSATQNAMQNFKQNGAFLDIYS